MPSDKTPTACIDADVRARFPYLRVLLMSASNLSAVVDQSENSALAAKCAARLATLDIDRLLEESGIAIWREAYKAMGVKTSDHRSSVEQLTRRALRGNLGSTGVPVVDLYNRASIAALAPMGAYDMAEIDSAIIVRALRKTDRFEPIGDAARFSMAPSVIGYTIGDEVICWALNCRDAQRTALKRGTDNALFISEAIDPPGAERSRAALELLSEHLTKTGARCGAISEATWTAP